MSREEKISFLIKLNRSDWQDDPSGWNCSVLKIPSAEVKRVFSGSEEFSLSDYEAEQELGMIRWRSSKKHPEQIAVLIQLNESLSTKAETDKWKTLTAILTPAAAILAAIITSIVGPVFLEKYNGDQVEISPSKKIPESVNPFQVKYDAGEYPLFECGNVNSRLVYPIYIPASFENFQKVQDSFCKDAQVIEGKIMIASFSDEKEAEMFLEFIKEHFEGAWKGERQ
jgi:hypothetical protein